MVTDLMPITGTTDNDIVLIIGIIVKDQFQRHDNHRYAKNNHRRSDNRRYTKTVGIQMTTDMPEIIKVKENMQTKETMAKSSWKTLIPTMKQVKKRAQ
jgi:hypothetical protein